METLLSVVSVDSVDSESEEQDGLLEVDCVDNGSELLVLSSSDGGLRLG